jgi:hypothetical protein
LTWSKSWKKEKSGFQNWQHLRAKNISNKVEKKIKSLPGFDPITFTFSKNSNYGRENLLEV